MKKYTQRIHRTTVWFKFGSVAEAIAAYGSFTSNLPRYAKLARIKSFARYMVMPITEASFVREFLIEYGFDYK